VTDEQLAAIRGRVEAATEGPWRYWEKDLLPVALLRRVHSADLRCIVDGDIHEDRMSRPEREEYLHCLARGQLSGWPPYPADLRFIAHTPAPTSPPCSPSWSGCGRWCGSCSWTTTG
jgi:hypothetical protein